MAHVHVPNYHKNCMEVECECGAYGFRRTVGEWGEMRTLDTNDSDSFDWKERMRDSYKYLKDATPQELLEACIWFYRKNDPGSEQWIRLGFAMAQSNAWEQVAASWLREWREGNKPK